MGFSLRSHDGATVHRRDDGEHDEDRDGMPLGVSSLREGVGSAWIFVRSVPCDGDRGRRLVRAASLGTIHTIRCGLFSCSRLIGTPSNE